MNPTDGTLRSGCLLGKNFFICETKGKRVKGILQQEDVWKVKLETAEGHPEYHPLVCPWNSTHTLEAKHDGNQKTLACKDCGGIWLAIIEKDSRLEYHPKSATADYTEKGEIPILESEQANFVKDAHVDMMTEMQSQPSLVESRESAYRKIQERIEIGKKLQNQQISSDEEYEQAEWDLINWSKYNITLLSKLFDHPSISLRYEEVWNFDSESGYLDLDGKIYWHRKNLTDKINWLVGIQDQLELYDELSDIPPCSSDSTTGTNIFIGHGHSLDWVLLKDFINQRVKLPYDEFNRVSTAGVDTRERLAEMLDQACIAFLVMTAEDEQTDGTLHARENVIHEAGLFQGRLGFKKAIILLEDGCKEFSNIHGLGQIRFPKGNIKAIFEDIREVLEREGIIA
ncbi:MAG: nucleotide-binding protein [Candidatus Poribacteria bacterium]|nr:nucleotide-binding protein [Candidatus Poribacteria bacterium]